MLSTSWLCLPPLLVLAGLVSIRQTSPPTSHISNHTCLFVHYISLSHPSLFVILFPVSNACFSFAFVSYLVALIKKLVYLYTINIFNVVSLFFSFLCTVSQVSVRHGPLWWSTMMPIRSGSRQARGPKLSAGSKSTTTPAITPSEWWDERCRPTSR